MMKVFYYPLKTPVKVNVLAAGAKHTKLFLDDQELLTFHEVIIPVAEKSRLVENVEREGNIYDALVLTELTYLTGYGMIEDTISPQEAVKAIEENDVEFEEADKPFDTQTRILYFEEKLADSLH